MTSYRAVVPSRSKVYSRRFFSGMDRSSRPSAEAVIPFVCGLPGGAIRSVLDVGCGIGVWLSVFAARGIETVGVDGDYVSRDELLIPGSQFVAHDLTAPLDLHRRFDLVVSLEVGEHLDANAAERYVASLVRHGDVVLFSAAIPFQGGVHHVNEQWPAYWISLFSDNGYRLFDVVRPAIWDDERVLAFYRQNLLLFASGTKADVLASSGRPLLAVTDVVHPGIFLGKATPRPWKQRIRRRLALRTRLRRPRA